MSRRLLALALVAAFAGLAAPARAEEVCVRGVCANAPTCGSLCLHPLLDFQCTDDAQAICDVRDLIRG